MTVAKSRYMQIVVLIIIGGLTYMAWIRLPRSIGDCPEDPTAKTKQSESDVRTQSSRSSSNYSPTAFLFPFLILSFLFPFCSVCCCRAYSCSSNLISYSSFFPILHFIYLLGIWCLVA